MASSSVHVARERVVLDVDLLAQRLSGFVEIEIWPTRATLDEIALNCRQCTVTAAYVNAVPATFTHDDPMRQTDWPNAARFAAAAFDELYYDHVLTASTQRELTIRVPPSVPITRLAKAKPPLAHEPSVRKPRPAVLFDPTALVGPDAGGAAAIPSFRRQNFDFDEDGEDELFLADQVAPAVESDSEDFAPEPADASGAAKWDFEPLVVRVEYTLDQPQSGVHFVLPDGDAFPLRAPHMFTSPVPDSTRLWVPCVDDLLTRPVYELEITVDAAFIAVAAGQLLEQILSADGSKRTFLFLHHTPTAAHGLSLAVGPFEVLQDAATPFVTAFCLPGRAAETLTTTSMLVHIFAAYERLLGVPYPHGSFKVVFVEEAFAPAAAYATVAHLSSTLLYSADVLDQVPESTLALARVVAAQLFGNYLDVTAWSQMWVLAGLCGHMAALFARQFLGANEQRWQLEMDMATVRELDDVNAPERHPLNSTIGLGDDAAAAAAAAATATAAAATVGDEPLRLPHPAELFVSGLLETKAPIVMHILERRAGHDRLFKTLGAVCRRALDDPAHLVLDFASDVLKKLVKAETSLASFLDMWVERAGYPTLTFGFWFARKQHLAEFVVRQELLLKTQAVHPAFAADDDDDAEATARALAAKYIGPITIRVQEFDGMYDHVVHLDDAFHQYMLPVYSKHRKAKHKHVMLENGVQAELDVLAVDDAPLLWVRVDPYAEVIGRFAFVLPEHMHVFQARYARDIGAQVDAIHELGKLGTETAVAALAIVLGEATNAAPVRVEAALALAAAAGKRAAGWAPLDALMLFTRDTFCYPDGSGLRPFDFSTLDEYTLFRGVVRALASVTDKADLTPTDVFRMLLLLLRTGDNSTSAYTDAHIVAELLVALASVRTAQETDVAIVLESIDRQLQRDRLLPSHRNVVTCACLRAFSTLVRRRRLPVDSLPLLRRHMVYGHHDEVRAAAYAAFCAVESGTLAGLARCVEVIGVERVPALRFRAVRGLMTAVPALRMELETADAALVRRLALALWAPLARAASFVDDARCLAAWRRLYIALFGSTAPRELAQDVAAMGPVHVTLKSKGRRAEPAPAAPKRATVVIPAHAPAPARIHIRLPTTGDGDGAGSGSGNADADDEVDEDAEAQALAEAEAKRKAARQATAKAAAERKAKTKAAPAAPKPANKIRLKAPTKKRALVSSSDDDDDDDQSGGSGSGSGSDSDSGDASDDTSDDESDDERSSQLSLGDDE